MAGMTMEVGLLEYFAELEDPRTRCSPHGLLELLLTAIGAILSGADTWVAVSIWGRAKLAWLRQFLPFANGMTSHDTFGRVFALLDSAVFERCSWPSDGVMTPPAGQPPVPGPSGGHEKHPGLAATRLTFVFQR